MNLDEDLRQRPARQWSRVLQRPLLAERISCRGCPEPEEARFPHRRRCRIRQCVPERGLAPRADYPCPQLEDFPRGGKDYMQAGPTPRQNLEGIRRGGAVST